MSIVSDSIKNQRLIRDADGFSTDRIFIVNDVTGTPYDKLYDAMLQAGVPQYGDPHPSIPEIQVTEITASPLDDNPNQVQLDVRYSVPSEEDSALSDGDNAPGVPVVSSSLVGEETHLDINNEFLVVTYHTSAAVIKKYEPTTVQRPQMRVTLTRIEEEIPKDDISTYLGTVNEVEWSGYPAKTWLCSGIDSRIQEGKWEVAYSFAYRKDTWRALLTTLIPQDSIDDFPADVESGNGFAIYDVYESRNFNELGLSF